MNNEIYLDNAATTPVNGEVINAMLPILTNIYGNNSSLHNAGRKAASELEKARDCLANIINAKSNEIYFTSGGTEANNWAIRGIAHANLRRGNHVITTRVEHHSVQAACHDLEREGFEVTYLEVDARGMIDFTHLLRAIRPNTSLISIIAANNEIGTIQNILAISRTAKEKGIIFHIDAVQLFGHMHIDVEELGIDAMSLSAHKIYGPKGTGVLYVKNNVLIANLITGGAQERGKRGGTVDVAGAVGFAKAAEIAHRDFNANNFKLKKLSEYLIKSIRESIDDIKFNGHPTQRLSNIVSVSFQGIEGESILTLLDLKNIYVSTGSACSSNTLVGSHVIKALGVPPEWSAGTIRFSLGKNNSFEEIDIVVAELIVAVSKLRAMSPIYKKRK